MLLNNHKCFRKKFILHQINNNQLLKRGPILSKAFHLVMLIKIIYYLRVSLRKILLLLHKINCKLIIMEEQQQLLRWIMLEVAPNKKMCHWHHHQKRNLQTVAEQEKALNSVEKVSLILSKLNSFKATKNKISKVLMFHHSHLPLLELCKAIALKDKFCSSNKWTAMFTSMPMQIWIKLIKRAKELLQLAISSKSNQVLFREALSLSTRTPVFISSHSSNSRWRMLSILNNIPRNICASNPQIVLSLCNSLKWHMNHKTSIIPLKCIRINNTSNSSSNSRWYQNRHINNKQLYQIQTTLL